MRVEFNIASIASLDVPDSDLVGVFRPCEAASLPDEAGIARRALAEPIGTPALPDLARGKRHVVILADDNTRSTRMDVILPPVLDGLAAAGVRDEQITILLALGTHRAMTAAEIDAKLGAGMRGHALRVVNHDWDNPAVLADLGKTEHGTPIQVNRLALEADLLIGLGHCLPHRVVGYSAGCKIIQPGISGAATTGYTHWLSAQYSLFDMLGVVENPVRAEVDAVGMRVGLAFIVNTVQDACGHVLGVYAGHPIAAHRAAAKHAEEMALVAVPEPADIAIADAWPADLDMWQAVKAIFGAALGLKRGGVVVLVAACPEGVADQHPELLDFGYRSVPEVRKLLEEGRIRDLSAAAHLAHVGEAVADYARCVLVAPGVSAEETRRLNLAYAVTPQEGLAVARVLTGLDSPRVMVLKNAADALVRVRQQGS